MLSRSATLDPDSLFGGSGLLEQPALIAAISGGSDSLALLFLLHDWLRSHRRESALTAVTIDHRLRPESGSEAERVGQVCAAHGIRHMIRRWDTAKPAAGLSAAAREARYGLLIQAADDAGARIILTGHTADDQAETVAMRAARGDGQGLAGMAGETLLQGRFWLLRPLLAASRGNLRDYLTSRQIGWLEDPSNTNPAFERARIRAMLSESEREQLAAQAAHHAQRRIDLGGRAAALLRAHGVAGENALLLDGEFLKVSDQDACLHALRFCLAAVGRREQQPDPARTAQLRDALVAQGGRATLAGCVISYRRGLLQIARERRGDGPQAGDPAGQARAVRRIVPGFDLPLAAEAARLLGAMPVPPAPSSCQKAHLP